MVQRKCEKQENRNKCADISLEISAIRCENKLENDRKDEKKMENEHAKMMKKGHFLSKKHEKDGYLGVPFPDV
jgi:hypothetical protein